MSKKYLALKDNNNSGPQVSRLEKAAETVSNDLDKVIHERMRLGIISALAANKKLSFTELKDLLNTSDGNISVHARKLEDAGYVNQEKSFRGRVPLTEYKITTRRPKSVGAISRSYGSVDKAMKKSEDDLVHT